VTAAPTAAPEHLLVRLPNPAGDVVLATPALRALRAALPRSRITWAGSPGALALLDGLPERDDTYAVSAKDASGALGPWKTGRAWRKRGVDAVLCFPNSWSSALAARASGAKVRVGYARRGRGFLLTHRFEQPRDARDRLVAEPMRRRYLRLAAALGAEDDGLPTRLVVTEEGERSATARLDREGVRGPFLAISPGAAFGPSKVYPPRLLATAALEIASRAGLVPLILCGPGEEGLAADVASRLPEPQLSTHRDRARWPETKSLLSRARLLLTPDAGPRHVAAALGVPSIVVMGPTDPGWTAGDRLATVVRRSDLSCLACHLKRCPIPGHPCMETLDPTILVRAALRRLAKAPEKGR
jgi:heptosyltransferase-2